MSAALKEIKPKSNALIKSKRGGARPGAGRRKGAINRATEEQKATIEELARSHAPEAIETLATVMKEGQTDAARVAAANSILDRGYGKARQNEPAPNVQVNVENLQLNVTQVTATVDELLDEYLGGPESPPTLDS
jgi:hypothetical protein